MTDTAMDAPQIARTLLFPYLNHAVRMYEEKYATRADIDAGMKFGCGYPVGPLQMLDQIGLDVVRDALAERYAVTGEERHRPADLLVSLVEQGHRGAATGRGFYSWADGEVITDDESPSPDDRPALRREIDTVGVVGTGTMASGIAEVFARSGYDVVVVGRGDEKVAGVRAGITRSLDKAVSKGKLEESGKEEVLDRLQGTTDRGALTAADLVVEAVAEDLTVKQELFAELDRVCGDETILATTTSSLPVTACADATARPARVLGMHFFNPAPVMKLVEVVTTERTLPDVDQTVRALCDRVGKVAVSCGDRAGFIVNALLFPYLNDAVRLTEQGPVTVAEVDEVVPAETGFPMGPFALLDVVGTDVALAIQQELHREFRESALQPAARLEELVAEGHLGRKTGRGFHDYA